MPKFGRAREPEPGNYDNELCALEDFGRKTTFTARRHGKANIHAVHKTTYGSPVNFFESQAAEPIKKDMAHEDHVIPLSIRPQIFTVVNQRGQSRRLKSGAR